MITKTKTVYFCETCRKNSMRKDSMLKHEEYCKYNTQIRCFNCKYFMAAIVPLCNHPDLAAPQQMHTKKSESMGHIKKYPDAYKNSILMPTECSAFEVVDLVISDEPLVLTGKLKETYDILMDTIDGITKPKGNV